MFIQSEHRFQLQQTVQNLAKIMLKIILVFMLHSFIYIKCATSALQFPKEHQFNCMDMFSNDHCTKYTQKVFVYDSIINKCVKQHWRGCPTGNMFFDAENCNNACTLCISEEGASAEFMDLKYFTQALSPKNKTVFYQVLNSLEGQLRMLAGRNTVTSKRANNAVEFQDNSDEKIKSSEKTVASVIDTPSKGANNVNDRIPDRLDVENNKYDENENDADGDNGNPRESKNDDNQEEEDNNDDNWEDENSEWDIK